MKERVFEIAYYNKGNPFMQRKNVKAKSLEEAESIIKDSVDFDRIEYILIKYISPDDDF